MGSSLECTCSSIEIPKKAAKNTLFSSFPSPGFSFYTLSPHSDGRMRRCCSAAIRSSHANISSMKRKDGSYESITEATTSTFRRGTEATCHMWSAMHGRHDGTHEKADK